METDGVQVVGPEPLARGGGRGTALPDLGFFEPRLGPTSYRVSALGFPVPRRTLDFNAVYRPITLVNLSRLSHAKYRFARENKYMEEFNIA